MDLDDVMRRVIRNAGVFHFCVCTHAHQLWKLMFKYYLFIMKVWLVWL